jgi:putative transposase
MVNRPAIRPWIRAVDAITVLEAAIQRYGPPQYLRSDSGLAQEPVGQKRLYPPGAPWEQAYIESFHDKLRDECLNREIFSSLLEARLLLEQWRADYNTARPHSGLGNLPPAAFPGADVQPVTNNNNALQTAKS